MKIKDLADLEILKECLTETDLGPEVGEDNHRQLAFVEKEIVCKLCGKTFIFTPGEQEFYKSKNFPDPKCCRKCAKKRRLKFLKL